MSRRSGEARLLREALAIEAEDAQASGALGFMARLLVQTTLPHSRRRELSFVRSNGRLHVSVTAHPLLGLPYGRYPRLLLAWVTTEAVRTKSRHLRLGPSLSRFMVRLGLTPSGGPNGPIGRLREQMRRLFGATIAFTQDGQSDGEWHDTGFRVAREIHLWWDPQDLGQAAAWRSTVTLSQGFFEAITERPVPVDLRALRALRSPLALDLYLWLTYRNSYLRRPTRVPWALLAMQIGSEYRDQRDFKRKVLRSLRRVLVVYPTARVQQVRGGLRLRPAPCHVRRSAIHTG